MANVRRPISTHKLWKSWHLIPILHIDHLRKKLPRYLSILVFFPLAWIAQYLPKKLMILIPSRFALIFGLLAGENNKKIRNNDWLDKAKKHELTRDLATYHLADMFDRYGEANKLSHLIDGCVTEAGLIKGDVTSILSWANFNLGFQDYGLLLDKVIKLLESEDLRNPESNLRFLPYHANYLGHISLLQKYISYYSITDKDRVLGIWSDSCVNRYYLDKVIDWSPLKIQMFDGKPPKTFADPRTVEFTVSRERQNKWRVDLANGSYTGQSFPEANPPESHFLEINEVENVRAQEICKSIGLNLDKWFVCLHVRQGPLGFTNDSNRDADILSYRDFCKQVLDMGGQVIRMGDPSFPKLPTDFPAIDYAHSEARSTFFDTWLWGSCRWWTGTNNGPAGVAMTFGKPRLMTNSWLWEGIGQVNDLWMPKQMVDTESGRILTPNETIRSGVSRACSKEKLEAKKLLLRPNSPSELKEAAIEMFERTIPDIGFTSSPTELEKHFSQVMRIPYSEPHVSFPKYYAGKWESLLPDNFLEEALQE